MFTPSDPPDDSLLELMEQLVECIELRDASDPDAPPWEAQRQIARLEAELARRVGSVGQPVASGTSAEEVLVATAS